MIIHWMIISECECSHDLTGLCYTLGESENDVKEISHDVFLIRENATFEGIL